MGSVRAGSKGQVQRWQFTAELECSWGSSPLSAVTGGYTAPNHLGHDAGPLASQHQKSSSCVACPGIGVEVTTKTRVVARRWLVSDLLGLRIHYLHISHSDSVNPSSASHKGSDRASVLGTGEAAPRVLCSVLVPSLQEGHWVAGARPEQGNKASEGSGEQFLWGVAEGAGIV